MMRCSWKALKKLESGPLVEMILSHRKVIVKLINKITSCRFKSHTVDVPVREMQWDSVHAFAYIVSLW